MDDSQQLAKAARGHTFLLKDYLNRKTQKFVGGIHVYLSHKKMSSMGGTRTSRVLPMEDAKDLSKVRFRLHHVIIGGQCITPDEKRFFKLLTS
jgi:hypothetical protein